MQGTVKEFSEETRSGSVILDDGTELALPAATFSRSGLLKLAAGQRVRIEVRDGVVETVNIVTLR
jgi:cold shock CspA family protein